MNSLYELPNGWTSTRIGDVAKVSAGNAAPQGKSFFQAEGVPFIRVQDLGRLTDDWYIGDSKDHVTDQAVRSSRLAIVPKGAVLFTKSGMSTLLNQRAILSRDSFVVSHIGYAVTSQALTSEWLFLALKQIDFRSLAQATTLPSLGLAKVKEIAIPLPPLAEQKRIVKKTTDSLTKLFAARSSLRRVPPLIKQFRQSILTKAFRGELTERDSGGETAKELLEKIGQNRRKKWEEELKAKGKHHRNFEHEELGVFDTSEPYNLPDNWTWTTVGAIETFIGSGITPLGGQNVYVSDGIPFIRSQNVYPEGLHLEDIVYITPRMHAEMRRSHVRAGDVLLNITGASIGRSTYAPDSLGEANVNQHVCIIRTGWWIVPAYLSNFLNSPIGQDQIFATESGVTREGLNYAQLRRLKVPLAPLGIQKRVAERIADVLNQINRVSKAVLEATIEAASLERSVLRDAFQGRLVSQDPNDEPASVLLERTRANRMEIGEKGRSHTILETSNPARITSKG